MATAIIAAAGSGKRMGEKINKVFIPLGEKPILLYSVQALAACPEIDNIIVTAASGEENIVEELLKSINLVQPWQVITGGNERQYSVAKALKAVKLDAELILIHDGARPLIQIPVILETIAAARRCGAAVAAVPVKDTIKIAGDEGFSCATPERAKLWSVQTPQVFQARLLRQAYEKAEKDGVLATDDAALVERLGVGVKLVPSSYSNIKVTTPEDLVMAQALITKGAEQMMRFGIGYDVHRLVTGRKLILGGVEIPFEFGLEGHSDADVLLHAIKDALLGAAALGDIGRHFPDTDEQYKGISSLKLLAAVRKLLAEKGWVVNNIDAVVIAERPKIAAYIAAMNSNIATALNLAERQVNVKATTTEGLGFVGRREGIAAQAIASITRAV